MSGSSGSSADPSMPQEVQRQGHDDVGHPVHQHEGFPVRSNPLLLPTLMPQLSTVDRMYAEMMDDMSRIHHEMNRFYRQHLNPVSPFMQGAQPQACESRPWWRPSSWFQHRNPSHAPMALETGSSRGPEVIDLRGHTVPLSSGQGHSPATAWDVMPFGWGNRGGVSTGSIPKVDMRDTGSEFLVHADVPGMDRENLRVDVHDGVLRISGSQGEEKTKQEEGFYLQERSQSSFSRSFILPEKVKEDEIKASLTSGVLQVHVPKETPTQPPAIRNITIE